MSRLGLVDVVQQARLADDVNVLVFVDQFEELFRFRERGEADDPHDGRPDEQAVAFVALLIEAARQRRHRIHVVLTMRSDFLGDCAAVPGLAEAINEGQYLVPRMTREERRLAITGPLDVAGVRIHPILLTRLLNDVDDDPDQLSILQHALNRIRAVHLEGDNGEGALDLTHYSAIGSMAHALDRHAETVWTQLADDRQRWIAERLLKALTDTSTDPRGVRRPMSFGKLCALCAAPPDELARVIDAFRRADRSFLMPPADEPLEPDTIVDISHESLMRTWRRLVRWAEQEATSARIYRRLLETARLHRRGEAGLWRDPDLGRALAWRKRERPNAAWADRYGGKVDTAMRFLDESAAERETERARELAEVRQNQELEQARALGEEQRARIEAQERAAKVQRKVTRIITAALVVSALLTLGIVWLAVSEGRKTDRASHNLRQVGAAYAADTHKWQTIWQLTGARRTDEQIAGTVVFRNGSDRARLVYTLSDKGREIERAQLAPNAESRIELFQGDVWMTREPPNGRLLDIGVVEHGAEVVLSD